MTSGRNEISLADSNAISVIEVGGTPAGGLMLNRAPGSVDVVELQILPEHQGKGIGTSIFAQLVDDAAGERAQVTLSIVGANHRARHLYERIGFQVIGFEEPFIRMRHRSRPT